MPVNAGHTMVDVTQQAEEYLEAICRIQDRGQAASPTALANELSVAPPSVLGMLRRLEEQGLLCYQRKTGALLTDKGRAFADRLRRRHRLAERLLTDLLGMPWQRAHEVACRFEHVIDDEVEEYLSNALNHPSTCPHGNPLGEQTSQENLQSLDKLQPDDCGILRCVTNESSPMLDYLNSLELRPGAKVTIISEAPMDGPLTIEVAGHRHALSREMAACLWIEQEGQA